LTIDNDRGSPSPSLRACEAIQTPCISMDCFVVPPRNDGTKIRNDGTKIRNDGTTPRNNAVETSRKSIG
jgi:hypothetical protein